MPHTRPKAQVAVTAKGRNSLAGEQSCDVCGAGNCKRRCGRCREAYYCSEECQRSAWPAHKEACAAPAANRVTPTKL